MKELVILDLFSGIGGFSAGFERAGYKLKHYFSEIDKHAIAIYKYHFKDATYVGSVTDLVGGSIPRPNIITFGSPCQDFSLAGKRRGLEGQRSSLIGQAIRLITECRPDVFIWENVKGAFSSNNSEDFWAIIQAFTNIGGYRLEWQLLNTSWLLPQNRERIYLIGHLATTGRDFKGVFPVTENGREINLRPKGAQSYIVDTNYLERDCRIYDTDAPTVNARDYKDPKIVMVGDYRQDEGFRWRDDGNAPTICGASKKSGTPNCSIVRVDDVAPMIVAQRGRGDENTQQLESRKDSKTNTLTGVQKDNLVFVGGGVFANSSIRRLTEIECERLQGFSDGWTEYGDYDGIIKKVAKTQRYKTIGNAVTVNVVQLIAERLSL